MCRQKRALPAQFAITSAAPAVGADSLRRLNFSTLKAFPTEAFSTIEQVVNGTTCTTSSLRRMSFAGIPTALFGGRPVTTPRGAIWVCKALTAGISGALGGVATPPGIRSLAVNEQLPVTVARATVCRNHIPGRSEV